MKFYFDKSVTQNFKQAVKKEWLETNGLGGWASSTIIGANTRRYHGLLVAATHPPVGRMVLVSKLDEVIVRNEQRFELGCNQYPGALHPQGYRYLQSFEKKLFPIFQYEAGGVVLRKTIAAVNGENTTLILYQVLQSPSPFVLEMQPLIAARNFHRLTQANYVINRNGIFQSNILRIQPYQGTTDIFIAAPRSSFQPEPDWYYHFEYRIEQYRGLDFQEDLFSYGFFQIKLAQGDNWGVIISTANPAGRDAFALLKQETQRREKLVVNLPSIDDFARTLTLAADQFIVRRGNDLSSIIAGYHWFADWGRDTMIALPGLCLATGRFEEAKKILCTFAKTVSRGMLPNRFPDLGEDPEYNTVDATLWFFIAIYRYLRYTDDEDFVRDELVPILREIMDWHYRGTRYHIHVDSDGLLYAGETGVQLTWMDAMIGDWVVTPRYGKAVEINALWYNALRIYAHLLHRFDETDLSREFEQRAEQVRQQFQKTFWYNGGGYLYDYIDGDYHDPAIRPNQLFAISLPFPLLTGVKAKQVLRLVEEKLYTPFGLRSLSPDDPNYHPRYCGDPVTRDSAYHQGTVWSWLLGPYSTALIRFSGKSGLKKVKRILAHMESHLRVSCIGSVSEICDAEPPFTQRGAVAQAWSVGELLRVYHEDILKHPYNRNFEIVQKSFAGDITKDMTSIEDDFTEVEKLQE